jgi:hypothetical protein
VEEVPGRSLGRKILNPWSSLWLKGGSFFKTRWGVSSKWINVNVCYCLGQSGISSKPLLREGGLVLTLLPYVHLNVNNFKLSSLSFHLISDYLSFCCFTLLYNCLPAYSASSRRSQAWCQSHRRVGHLNPGLWDQPGNTGRPQSKKEKETKRQRVKTDCSTNFF